MLINTLDEYDKLGVNDLLDLECDKCGVRFQKTKKSWYYSAYKRKVGLNFKVKNYCSKGCWCKRDKQEKRKDYTCLECKKTFEGLISQSRKFCSSSCSVTYNNTHKTKGNVRSKLEIWMENKLSNLYPNLEIHFNKKDAINSELDIYIPSLKLAFELNGLFHYEPIFGINKLNQIQNNDNRKFQACLERGIELCVIDTSGLKYFKEQNAIKYYDIIVNIINSKTRFEKNT